MDSNRYFLLAPELYQQIRAGLDAGFGHPNGKAGTCLAPSPLLYQGRAVVGILRPMLEWPEVAAAIASLSGQIEEITSEQRAEIMTALTPIP